MLDVINAGYCLPVDTADFCTQGLVEKRPENDSKLVHKPRVPERFQNGKNSCQTGYPDNYRELSKCSQVAGQAHYKRQEHELAAWSQRARNSRSNSYFRKANMLSWEHLDTRGFWANLEPFSGCFSTNLWVQ